MWMVSAIDFVMIFVSLELVTISFYVLVSLHPSNSGDLGSGREVSRPERALDCFPGLRHHLDFRSDRRDQSPSFVFVDDNPHGRSNPPPLWDRARAGGARVQGCGSPISNLGA
jgi:hypothetical protein